MADQEIVIDNELVHTSSVEPEDLTITEILGEEVSATPDRVATISATQIASLNADTATEGSLDWQAMFDEAKADVRDNRKAIEASASSSAVSTILNDIGVAGRDMADENPEATLDIAQDVIDAKQQVTNIIPEGDIDRAFTESLALDSTAEQKAKDANYLFFAKDVATMMEETGILDTAINIAGLFIPGGAHKDWMDITGVTPDKARESIKGIIQNFQSLSAAEQRKQWPYIKELFLGGTDSNEIKAAALLIQTIDPTLTDEIDLIAAFDAADALLTYPFVISKVFGVIQKLNSLHALNTVSKQAAASQVVANAAKDVTPLERAASTSPFKFEKILPGSVDNLADDVGDIVQDIEANRASLRADLDEVIEGTTVHVGGVSLGQKQVVQAAIVEDELEVLKVIADQRGYPVGSVEIIHSDDVGFTLQRTVPIGAEESGGVVRSIEETTNYKYTVDDVGELAISNLELPEKLLSSPDVWMNRASALIVERATIGGWQAQGLANTLRLASQKVLKVLGGPVVNRKSWDKVNRVLREGDRGKKVYSIEELLGGVETTTGIEKLTSKEVAGYFASRDLYDISHHSLDMIQRRRLTFMGFDKEIPLGEKSGRIAVGKVFDDPKGLVGETLSTDTILLDTQTGTRIRYGDVDIKDLYLSGAKITKFSKPELVGERVLKNGRIAKEKTVWGITNDDLVGPLRQKVLHKPTGFTVRTPEESNYFVKMYDDMVLNGKVVQGGDVTTVASFTTKKEAEAFVKNIDETGINPITGEPEAFVEGRYKSVTARELRSEEMHNEIIGLNGGMFNSRSSREILHGIKQIRPKYEGPITSLERQLGYIATMTPMAEFRMGLQEMWRKSAAKYLRDPNDFNSEVLKTLKDGTEVPRKVVRSLEETRTWIKAQLNIPTTGERLYQNRMVAFSEWVDSKPLAPDVLRSGAINMSKKNPLAMARSAAFHTLLGWFNPASLWVQAQGSIVALSLDPLGAPRRLQKYMALRSVMFAPKNDKLVDMAAKAAGVDKAEMKEIAEIYRKSNMHTSAKTTADYAAAANGYPIGFQAVRNLADKGLVFFTEGERFTRGYSFLLAYDKWKVGAVAGKKVTDADIRLITANTLRKMLNMNKANAAYWQKGALGNATQFWQPTAKFAEAMLATGKGGTGKFTTNEKIRMMMGQSLLYGTTAVPLATMVVDWAATSAGVKKEDISSEMRAAIRGGFSNWASTVVFGEEKDVASRGAYLSGIEATAEAMFVRDMPISQRALGASWTPFERGFEAVKVLSSMLMTIDEREWTADDMITGAVSVGKVLSSVNNAEKAYIMYKMGEVRNRDGAVLYDMDKKGDLQKTIGQALGFSPMKTKDLYHDLGKQINQTELKKKLSKAALTKQREFLDLYRTHIPTEQEVHNHQVDLDFILSPLSPWDRKEIKNNFGRTLQNPKTMEDRLLQKQVEDAVLREAEVTAIRGLSPEEQESRE